MVSGKWWVVITVNEYPFDKYYTSEEVFNIYKYLYKGWDGFYSWSLEDFEIELKSGSIDFDIDSEINEENIKLFKLRKFQELKIIS